MFEPYGLIVVLLGLIMVAYTFKEFYRKRIGINRTILDSKKYKALNIENTEIAV
jgi:hypothetical protein